jgi:hypothetical protein
MGCLSILAHLPGKHGSRIAGNLSSALCIALHLSIHPSILRALLLKEALEEISKAKRQRWEGGEGTNSVQSAAVGCVHPAHLLLWPRFQRHELCRHDFAHACLTHACYVMGRYEDWRRRVLSGVKAGRRLRNMLLWTIIPAVVALHVSQAFDTHL